MSGAALHIMQALGGEPAADGAPGCGVIADHSEGGGDGDGED